MIKKLEQQLEQVTSVEDIEILIENNGGIIFADTEKRFQEDRISFLTNLAKVISNFGQNVKCILTDYYGHFHPLWIVFLNERPRVYTGFDWTQYNSPTDTKECQYRFTKELISDDKEITQKTFYPAEAQDYTPPWNTEKYDQTAEILFDELKHQYIEKKKNSHKKTITK